MRITRLSPKNLVSIVTRILFFGILTLSLLSLPSRSVHIVFASSMAKTPTITSAPFTITGSNFQDGGTLSVENEFNKKDCTGGNTAPVLNWKNEPAGTASFVLLMIDHGAKSITGFHHWIVYNIPATAHQLKGNNAFTEGQNDFGVGHIGYDGPCPAANGQVHDYLFVLYAIKTANIGVQGLTYDQVASLLPKPVMLGATTVVATFRR